MQPIATAQQVSEAEQRWFSAHPGSDAELMQRAARAVTEVADEMLAASRRPAPHTVVVLAGRGNNAGDALYAAASLAGLDQGRVHVLVWAPFDQTHPGGMRAALGAGALLVSRAEALQALTEASLVIDGLFGIGGRAGLPEPVRDFAAGCLAEGVEVLCVDLPSGLDADSGAVSSDHLRATRTVTFIAAKPVHVLEPAASRCGEIEVVDIGVSVPDALGRAWDAEAVAAAYPWPAVTTDKYARGVVGLDTGSQTYPGAGVLSAIGAAHAGAGMVRCASPESVATRVLDRLPHVVSGAGRVQAWLCGSGWGASDDNPARLQQRLTDGVPLVVDADALTLLDGIVLPDNSLLTPHAGELARLLGIERSEVEDDPIGTARRAARQHGATVLLKGATQVIASPNGPISVAVPGPSWTAQAGSGDVLAGVCSALLAAGLTAHSAGAVGASLQAMTAAAHPGPWPPHELAAWLPETIADLPR